jgi:Zn-dependent protease
LIDLSPETLIPRIVVVAVMLLIAFPFHEFAHAYAAYRLGDSTARLFGRMTLDPVAHFDPVGGGLLALSVIFAGFGFGWAKPTPVNPMNLRQGRWGEAIVSAAGPLSNLVLAVVASIIFRILLLVGINFEFLLEVVYLFVVINLVLMVFNLLPIPPLDGSKVLYAFLDPRTAFQVRPFLEQYGVLILLVAVFFPLFGGETLLGLVFNAVLNPLTQLLLGI